MIVTKYTHPSRIGLFRLERREDGMWGAWCDNEFLGPYQSAAAALADLCGGHTDWPGGIDPSTLGLPDELADWAAGNR